MIIKRPAPMKASKMKVKKVRKVIGTFAEIGMLIQSITQVLYDVVKDYNNGHWLWLLEIRKFLRFIKMPKITASQV